MLPHSTILAGRTVLLVDATPSSRQMISAILRDHGCRSQHFAKHAREALDLLDVTAGQLDLVITAVDLPRISGLELVRAIRLGRTRGLATTPAALFHPRPDRRLHRQAEDLDIGHVFGLPIVAAGLCQRLAELIAGPRPARRDPDSYAAVAIDWEPEPPTPTPRSDPTAREAASREAERLSAELHSGPAPVTGTPRGRTT